MRLVASRLPRHPHRRAIARRHALVRADGELELDEGALPHDAQDVAERDPMGLVGQRTDADLKTGSAQAAETAAADAGVRVLDGADHAAHACLDDGLGAGRRLPMMGTGLKRHIESGVSRPLPRLREGDDFGMGPPAGLGPSAPDDLCTVLADQDGADGGVRPGASQAPLGQAKGNPHECSVVGARPLSKRIGRRLSPRRHRRPRARPPPRRPTARPTGPRNPAPRGNSCKRTRNGHRRRRPAPSGPP